MHPSKATDACLTPEMHSNIEDIMQITEVTIATGPVPVAVYGNYLIC